MLPRLEDVKTLMHEDRGQGYVRSLERRRHHTAHFGRGVRPHRSVPTRKHHKPGMAFDRRKLRRWRGMAEQVRVGAVVQLQWGLSRVEARPQRLCGDAVELADQRENRACGAGPPREEKQDCSADSHFKLSL